MPPKISGQTRGRKHFIKEWRVFRGLTQEKLAGRLETTKQSISRIEKGEQPYTQQSLEAIADALDCTPAELISRDPNDEPDIPIFDLPLGDAQRVRDFIRALSVTRTRLDGTPSPEPEQIIKPEELKQLPGQHKRRSS